MQFSKTSKKTRTIAEQTADGTEIAQAETSKPRATRSSQSKSSETSETGSAKHRKAATKSNAVEQSAPAEVKAVSPVASASRAFEPERTEHSVAVPAQGNVTHDEIAVLAHSYWVARGYAPGSPEQDWLRAECELRAKL